MTKVLLTIPNEVDDFVVDAQRDLKRNNFPKKTKAELLVEIIKAGIPIYKPLNSPEVLNKSGE